MNTTKDYTSNNDIKAINNVRTLLNELRDNLSYEEKKRIREKLYKQEAVYNFLMEKDSLTNKEKKVLKNIDRYLKNIGMHLKNLKSHFKKLQKYQYVIDYLFNEHNEEDYTSNNDINAFKRLESFFMNVEATFYLRKQIKLEKNFIKKKLFIIF